MTEAEWLASADPDHLLKWLQKSKRHRPSRRKLGLFACACAGRLRDRMTDGFTVEGLALAERAAEGLADPDEFRRFLHQSLSGGHRDEFGHIAVWAVRVMEPDVNWTSPEGSARSVAGYVAQAIGGDEPARQSDLLRDVIGNPFRPAALDPAWRTSTVLGLAEAIYADRAFDRLPILADALEDAGCDQPDVLAHCRGPGPHVRGCWVVDLVLGKS